MGLTFTVFRAIVGVVAGFFALTLFENHTTANTAISLFCGLIAALCLYPFITGGASSFLSGGMFV